MKRIFIIGYATLLFTPVVYAQEDTPAPPPVEPQVPAEHPGMSRSTPPSQAVVPVPVPMAPPKPNGPVQKSLVRITATAVDPDYKAPWNAGGLQRGVGAGFVISGNRIMTNAHVVANSRYITVERDGDPNKYPAQVQFIANDCDLALITVPAKDFFKNMVPLKLGGIPALESTVSAYGYPIGGERMSVTTGIVSRVDFQLYTHSSVDQHLAIQISAQINPGNSGGPVMQDGKVVGVAFQGYSGDVAQGVAYMIPTPVINRFLKDIRNGQYDEYPDLAITYAKLQNPAQRKFLGLKDDDRGVLVGSVVASGPSDGVLKSGDVLLSIDGHPIASDANVEIGWRTLAIRGSRGAQVQRRLGEARHPAGQTADDGHHQIVQAVAIFDSGSQLRCATALCALRRVVVPTAKPGHAGSLSHIGPAPPAFLRILRPGANLPGSS